MRTRDGKFPWTYLGKPLAAILDPLGMSVDEFVAICDHFTNTKIFRRDSAGAFVKARHGNFEKLNADNA